MKSVSRSARLIDLASLILIVSGALVCVASWLQLTELSKLSYRHPGPPNQSALTAADHARYGAWAGVFLVVAGCSVAVAGTMREKKRLS